jgi:molybdenum cofactor cytidylyltransferase
MSSPDPIACALILLAAGASQRMGRLKQLLPVNGTPLVRHVAETALGAAVSPVVVVLGARAPDIAPCLAGLPVQIVVNDRWAQGMGASIRAGMQALTKASPAVEAVMVALADQPDFSADHLARMIEVHRRTGRAIVASEAGGVRRPPVLFAASWFPRLLTLEGDAGARALLKEQQEELAVVPLSAPADLDTPEDYARFVHQRKQVGPRNTRATQRGATGPRADRIPTTEV